MAKSSCDFVTNWAVQVMSYEQDIHDEVQVSKWKSNEKQCRVQQDVNDEVQVSKWKSNEKQCRVQQYVHDENDKVEVCKWKRQVVQASMCM